MSLPPLENPVGDTKVFTLYESSEYPAQRSLSSKAIAARALMPDADALLLGKQLSQDLPGLGRMPLREP